jgi:very-short-patch-repair endonuclease
MKMDNLPARKKKTAQKPAKQPLRDVFTVICKTDLKVECVKEFKFHPVRKWRFDYAIPEHKIALEVEGGVWSGGRHTRPQGFLGDIEKYNTATLMGWRVFRTTPDDLLRTATLNLLKSAISGDFDPENGSFLP